MENNSNKYITVAYELYVEDGGKESMVEQAPAEHPFQFISGMGITLEAFEENIAKLNKGDKFDFVIPMADAYGEIDPTHILDLPKHFGQQRRQPPERDCRGNQGRQRTHGLQPPVCWERPSLRGDCHRVAPGHEC